MQGVLAGVEIMNFFDMSFGKVSEKIYLSEELFAKERTKYDLGSQEQKGHFRTGDGSSEPPLQSLIAFCLSVSRQKSLNNNT